MVRLLTRRALRARKLMEAHFLPFEARELSRVPFTVPFWKTAIEGRAQEFMDWFKKSPFDSPKIVQCQEAWVRYVKAQYREHYWLKNIRGKTYMDCWRMFHDLENRYRAKFPDYTSPWQKKRKSSKDFFAKLEHTLAHQTSQA